MCDWICAGLIDACVGVSLAVIERGESREREMLIRTIRRSIYIYSTYVYVQTYRMWKRGRVGKNGLTMEAGMDGGVKHGAEERGGE